MGRHRDFLPPRHPWSRDARLLRPVAARRPLVTPILVDLLPEVTFGPDDVAPKHGEFVSLLNDPPLTLEDYGLALALGWNLAVSGARWEPLPGLTLKAHLELCNADDVPVLQWRDSHADDEQARLSYGSVCGLPDGATFFSYDLVDSVYDASLFTGRPAKARIVVTEAMTSPEWSVTLTVGLTLMDELARCIGLLLPPREKIQPA